MLCTCTADCARSSGEASLACSPPAGSAPGSIALSTRSALHARIGGRGRGGQPPRDSNRGSRMVFQAFGSLPSFLCSPNPLDVSWCSLAQAQLAHVLCRGARFASCLARVPVVGLGITSSPRPRLLRLSEEKFCALSPVSLRVVLACAGSARTDTDSVGCQVPFGGLGESAEGVVAVFPPFIDMGEAPRTVVASTTPPRTGARQN